MLDFEAWKHIDGKWPNFANDTCNVRLGLALDGVNPFGDISSCYLTWLVVLFYYNLPSWLVTKRYFLILVLFILIKESCTFANVDVYLKPLIEELQILWKGVEAFVAYLGAKFNLKVMCMWNIHDFLAYNLLIGYVTKE